jgi:hypothetical protein
MIFAAALAMAAAADSAKLVSKQEIMLEFAACAVKNDPGRAREMLATPASSKQELDVTWKMISLDECIDSVAFSVYSGEVRAAVAEAYLEYSRPHWDAIASLPTQAPVRVGDSPPDERQFTIHYGTCLTMSEPQKARNVLETVPGSRAEIDAVLAFGDVLKGCMPEGLSYRLNPGRLRMVMATTLFDQADAKVRAQGGSAG